MWRVCNLSLKKLENGHLPLVNSVSIASSDTAYINHVCVSVYAHAGLLTCFSCLGVWPYTWAFFSFFAFLQNAHTGPSLSEPTSVMVVPAPSVVVLEDLWWAPGVQEVVHLVLLPPGQRLAKDLPGLVHVEVPGSQETQYVLVLRDLDSKGRVV